jgi:hypothetical protein
LDTLYREKGRGREKKKEERGTLIIIPDNAKYLEREEEERGTLIIIPDNAKYLEREEGRERNFDNYS